MHYFNKSSDMMTGKVLTAARQKKFSAEQSPMSGAISTDDSDTSHLQ